jgi:copper chaperone NosL
MTVVDRGFASQIVTPLDEPRFFDDMGCLSTFLTRTPVIPGAAVYVADRRTGTWVPAGEAVFVRVDDLTAPMGSHIVAYANDASRAADAAATAGTVVERATVMPAAWRGHRP